MVLMLHLGNRIRNALSLLFVKIYIRSTVYPSPSPFPSPPAPPPPSCSINIVLCDLRKNHSHQVVLPINPVHVVFCFAPRRILPFSLIHLCSRIWCADDYHRLPYSKERAEWRIAGVSVFFCAIWSRLSDIDNGLGTVKLLHNLHHEIWNVPRDFDPCGFMFIT